MLNNGLGLLRSESLKLQITDPRHIGGDAEKRNSLEKTSQEVKKQYEKLEEELKVQLAKVAEVTHRIQHETEQKLSLFQKEQSVMNKIYAPLKIIRGKK